MERVTTFNFREDLNHAASSGLFVREASSFYGGIGNSELTAAQQREILLRTNRFLPTGGSGGGSNSRGGGGGALAQRSDSGVGATRRFQQTGGSRASETRDLPFASIVSAFSGSSNKTNATISSSSSFGPQISLGASSAISPLIETSLLKWVGSTGILSHKATITKVVRLATGRHCIIVAGDQSISVIDENVLRVTNNNQSASADLDRSKAGGAMAILGGCGVTTSLLEGMAGFISSLDCKALPSSSKGEIVCAVGTNSARVGTFVIIPAAGIHAASRGGDASVGGPFAISVQHPLSLPTSTSNTVPSVDTVSSVIVGLDSVTKLPTFIAASTRHAVIMFHCRLPSPDMFACSASNATLQTSFDGFQLFRGSRVVKMVDVGPSASSMGAATPAAPTPSSSVPQLHRTDVVHNTALLSPSASVVLAILLDNSEIHFIAKDTPNFMRNNKFGRHNTSTSRRSAPPSGIFSLSPDDSTEPGSPAAASASSVLGGGNHRLRSISMSPRAVDDYSTVSHHDYISTTTAVAEESSDSSSVFGQQCYAPKGAIANLSADVDIVIPGQCSSLAHGDSTLPEFYTVAEFLSLKTLAERHQSIVAKPNTTHGGEAPAPGTPRTPRTSAQLDKPTLAPLLAFNDFKCFYNQTSKAIDIVAVGQCNSYSEKHSTQAGPFFTNVVCGFICTVRSALKCVVSSQTGTLILIPEDSSLISSVPSGIVSFVGSQASTERGLSTVNVIASALPSDFFLRDSISVLNTIPLSASLVTCNNDLFISSLSCPVPIVIPDPNNNGGGGVALKKGLKLLHSFGCPIRSVEVLGVHSLPTPGHNGGASSSRTTWFCDVLIGLGTTAQVYRLPLA